MGGRGSMGGTRSTYRGDNTLLFNARNNNTASDNGGGGGGNTSNNSSDNGNSDTGGIQNGGGNNGGGDGGSTVDTTTVNDTAMPTDDKLEFLFQTSPEFEAFDKRYQNSSEAVYNAKYAEELAKWIGLKYPPPPKPEATPSAPAPWYDKLKKNINQSNETIDDLRLKTEAINRAYTDSRANQINCQRVTAALEMQFKGYDMAANPITEGWKSRVYNPATDKYDNDSASFPEIAKMWRNPDVPAERGRWVVPTETDRATVVSKMEAEILSWGEGARGFVGVTWNADSAHIFNVMVRDGRAVYIDAQPTKLGHNLTYVDIQFDNTVSWKNEIDPTMWQGVMRVDNLEPMPRVGTWVRERNESEINTPKAEEVWPEVLRRVALAESDLNALPDDFDIHMAFFYGWQAAWMGKVRPDDGDLRSIAPKPIRNDEVFMQVFEMGLNWAERPL